MRVTDWSLRTLLSIVLLATISCGGETAPKAVGMTAFQGSQTGIAGTPVLIPPSVKVVDGSGKGFPGVAVIFAVTGGSGAVGGASTTTNADGVAAVTTWKLGNTVGVNTVTATATGLTGSPVTFSATSVAGAPQIVTASSGNSQSALVGSAIIPPSVLVTDAFANPIAGAQVTFAVASGGGSITGATQTTNATGFATVGSWTLGLTAGTNALTATVTGATPGQILATGTAGAATQLGIATLPTFAANNLALSPQPVVEIRDANNNVVPTATGSVTAAMASGVGTLTGALTINAVAGIARFTDLSISGITATGTASLKFTAAGLTQVTSSAFPTSIAPNLTIDGMYITQSTQTYQGTVPLIAGRAGLLRVFVKASSPYAVTPSVRVRLYQGTNLTTPVQTYTITAPTATVPSTVDEGTLTSSWNVALPASVIQAGLSVLADVDPTGVITEASKTDNTFPASGTPMALDVRSASTFNVTFVPIIQPNIVQGDVTDANVPGYMDYAMRVYPLVSYNAIVRTPYTSSAVLNGASYDITWTNMISEMNALRLAEAPGRYYYGVIHPGYSSGGTGFGYIGGGLTAAVGVDWQGLVSPSTNYRSMTAAHEWGHNFGRRHVDCGSPSSPDPNYPYSPSSIGVYGYDIVLNASRTLDLADFMSYCKPLWISDYTYKAVMAYRAAGGAPSMTATPQHGLLVWGHIGPSGVVLEPSFEIDAPPSLPTAPGPYSVRATDDAQNEIFALSFDGVEVDHAPGERHFAFVVPLSATAPQPTTLRLVANGREVIRRSVVPTSAPGVTATPLRLSQVAGQRSHLEWDATTYPMALVRDPATGQILSFARNGQIDIALQGRQLDVTLSDGVRSTRRLLAITPQ